MGVALEVRGLRKAYPGFLLDTIDLDITAGCVVGLVGPNGAGKTTVMKLILDLVRRDGGSIRVFGHDPLMESTVRRRMGVVHEVPRYPRHLTLADIRSTVAPFFPTWDEAVFRRLIHVFDLPLRQRFGRLSRGMKSRFALALALSHHAELLLLDEPTSGLDPVFRHRLLDVLREELQDERTAVLFSTHITSDLDHLADYVAMLIGGRVMLNQPMDEVAASWGMVRGAPEALPRLRHALRGVRETAVSFEAVTDDAARVRREGGAAVIVERASIEDILVCLARGEETRGGMNIEHRTGGGTPCEEEGALPHGISPPGSGEAP